MTNLNPYDIIKSEKRKERNTKMTDKEMMMNALRKNGFDPVEIGNTIQYTMRNGKTCIRWFTDDGKMTDKYEWVG